MIKIRLTQILLLVFVSTYGQTIDTTTNRWKIESAGQIAWQIKGNLPHNDHIEMSGRKISAILQYKVNSDSSFSLDRTIVWPMLRTIPNNTHASLIRHFNVDILKFITINGGQANKETIQEITLNGLMTVKGALNQNIELKRVLYPSTTLPVFCEYYTLKNNSNITLSVEIPELNLNYETDASKGVEGSYTVETKLTNNGTFNLAKGDSIQFGLVFCAYKKGETIPEITIQKELKARMDIIKEWNQKLVLETPDKTLNSMFAFAKIRGSESIFETKGGFMHGPGGEAYYAAVWANDQAEYIGPFFPFLGYDIGNQASMNAYMHFARYMNQEYKPIPSSIIAEGLDVWNGAGDRGDQAMIAYGASRFALALGNKESAEKLWNLIEWCLEYLNRNVNSKGVVSSDSDELEGRFPAGDANLCTSSLYYDALLSASYLGKELNKPIKQIDEYLSRAKILRQAIETHFGYNVDGFDTYRYYEGNDVLRAWVCMPLTVGIFERKQGTIDALFSPRLWTEDGLATQAGEKTFWDRSTLYALRGVFAAGEKEKALKFLTYYSNRRLLGEHVPYAVEAFPEGNQRHLSAESGLYCRIYTEGLFGIRPTGLKSFNFSPQLPKEWNFMSLKNINAFATNFDIQIKRNKEKIEVNIVSGNKSIFNKIIKDGESIKVEF
ncbi:MAG: hypothetical protein FD155_2711 [Bacteroidetes bacterium]|nr:MAG: hypothetical protein FD155_2711 [Bacteroidota bacterium]